MSSIQTYQLTVQKKYQVNQALRTQKQVKVVAPPVDDVTKHGPKAGEPEVTKEEIPFEKNVSSIQT